MIILVILFCIGFILMWIVAFFHALIKDRREEKALQNGSYDKYAGIYDPDVLEVLKDCDEVCSRSPIKKEYLH